MSSHEPTGPADPKAPVITTPGEVTLVNAQLPTVGQRPTFPAAAYSTPGLALAGARVPGAPTLPDPDPMAGLHLTEAISALANEMFKAPPGGGAAPAPSTPSLPSVPSAPPAPGRAAPPSPSAAQPAAIPSAPSGTSFPASPFHVEPDLSALAIVDPFAAVEEAARMQLPLLDRGVEPEPTEASAPQPTYAQERAVHARANEPPQVPFGSVLVSPQLEPASDASLAPMRSGPALGHVIKREFPILRETVNGRPLVWLDNAATTQKPQSVIDRISYFYEHENSNIHRAAHTLAARATDAYESARESVRRFINAPSTREIVFVRGTTEGINLVAQSWGRRNVGAGDEIVITWLEHHANIVPWQQLCSETGARLRVAPVDDRGQVILEEYEKLLGPKTKLVSFTQVSNALGTVTPAAAMIEMAHRHGAVVLLDGAQAVSHKRVDVQALGADFYVFSGHKVFGPTGIGAVFGRSAILDAMPPWQGGGNMIEDVTFERTRYQGAPARFEAGTGNIADAVGLGAALDWLSRVGVERVEQYEHDLLVYGTQQLATVPGLTMIGTAPEKAGVLSFVLEGQKTEELGGMLDRDGIAVRSGHHCAQPILRRFGVEASVRASLAPYNTTEDIDALVAALHRIQTGHRSTARRV